MADAPGKRRSSRGAGDEPLPGSGPGFGELRPFAVGYSKGAGEALVYGAVVFAAICAAAAMLQGDARALWGIVPAIVCAYRYYPMVEARRPQLGANGDGLFVAGIGFIDWAAIRQVDLFETSVRNIRLSSLRISLNRTLEEAIARPQDRPVWRAFMTRSWSVKRWPGGDGLEVELHPLAANPHDILSRIAAYKPDAVR